MKRIVDSLAGFFSPKFKKKLKRIESLDVLIKKLISKKEKIESKLEEDVSDTERKKYQTQVAVLQAQIEKAEQLLAEKMPENKE